MAASMAENFHFENEVHKMKAINEITLGQNQPYIDIRNHE